MHTTMKKVIFMIAAVICAALTSCSNDEFNEQGMSNQNIKFNIDVASITSGTRAIKQDWADGDKLNIWFNDNTQQTPGLVLTYDGTEWQKGDLRQDIDEKYFTDGCDILAYYEAYNDLNEYKYNDGQFSHTDTLGGTGYSQIPMYVYGYAKYSFANNTVSATIKDWLYDADMQVVVTGLDKDKADKYTLACDQLRAINYFKPDGNLGLSEVGTPVAGVSNAEGVAFYFSIKAALDQKFTFTLTDYTADEANPAVLPYTTKEKTLLPGLNKCIGIKIASTSFVPILVESIKLNKTEVNIGLPVTLSVSSIEPANATDKTITWSSDDETIATVDENGVVVGAANGTTTIRATANDGSGVKASCTVNVKNASVQLWADGPYFATCNVGADKPEGYGYFFMWGDTRALRYEYDPAYPTDTNKGKWVSVKDGSEVSITQTTCQTFNFYAANKTPYMVDGTYTDVSDHNWLKDNGFVDDSDNLVAQYDAATEHLGSPWRMPTNEELSALISNCTAVWTADYKGTGVAGELITGKGEYASRSIFLPAAGKGETKSSKGVHYFPNTQGYYSSSTAEHSSHQVSSTTYWQHNEWAIFFNSTEYKLTNQSRYLGVSVRPVYVPQ